MNKLKTILKVTSKSFVKFVPRYNLLEHTTMRHGNDLKHLKQKISCIKKQKQNLLNVK